MPTTIEWTDFVQKIADYTGVEPSEIQQDTNIYNDLGMDSLGLFSLGMYLIKEYHVKIPLTAVATIETVGSIFTLMNEQVGKIPA